MKIKKFDQLNEANEPSENEKIALANGFKIGDIVYNKKLKKNVKIVDTSREVIDDKHENTCTLGSIGEFPHTYTKIKQSDTNAIGYYKVRELNNLVSKAEIIMRKYDITYEEVVNYLKNNIK